MSSPSMAFQSKSRKSFIGILLLTFVAFLAQGVWAAEPDATYVDNELHKDNEYPSLAKRPSFFVGSRYGRSSGSNGASGNGAANGNGMGTSKTRRLIIVPRNDRFFLGSRYGKRSDEYLSPYEQSSLGLGMGMGLAKSSLREAERETEASNEKPSSRARIMMTMSCVYTGISNFYRCSSANAEDLNLNMGLDSNSIGAEDASNNVK